MGFLFPSPFTLRTGSIAAQVCTGVEPKLELAPQLPAFSNFLRRMPCLVPICGLRISRYLPARVRRKQAYNIQPIHPERPGFFMFCLGQGSL